MVKRISVSVEMYVWLCLAAWPATAAPRTIYVDDDAPQRLSSWGYLPGESIEDGSAEHPFDTIQEAVDAARSGDTVIVAPGTYPENVRLSGKPVKVRSVAPDDASVVSETVIEGMVTFTECEFAGGSLQGLTVRSVKGNAAIRSIASSPSITGCLVVHSGFGLAIDCAAGAPRFSRCTIELGPADARQEVVRCANTLATFTDCLITFNGSYDRRLHGQTYNLQGTPRSGPNTMVMFDPSMRNGAVYVVEGDRAIPTRITVGHLSLSPGRHRTVPPVPHLRRGDDPAALHPTVWDSTRPYIAPHLVYQAWSNPGWWGGWEWCMGRCSSGRSWSLHPSVSDPSLPYIAPHLLRQGMKCMPAYGCKGPSPMK